MRAAVASLFLVPLVLAGCSEPEPPILPAKPSTPPAAPPKVVGQTLPVAVITASQSGKTDPECVAPFTIEGAEGSLKIGAHTFRRSGSVLTLAEAPAPSPDREIVFGVIANIKEPTGDNLFNLKRYTDYFSSQKVDAILVAGDSGETKTEISGSLEPLLKLGVPVLAIPGNKEGKTDFHQALADLGAKYPNAVDMSSIRLVKLAGVAVMSLPGYYDPRYMHMGDAGCLYTKEDVYRLEPIMKAAGEPVLLLSHAEPHGTGREAIDAFQGGNAGDANITDFVRTRQVQFGVAANIQEAGPRATDLDSNVIREGEPHSKLFLNPGLADSIPWTLNDGTTSHGSVAILRIKGGKAAYQVFRVPALTASEETTAKKLAVASGEMH